MFFSGILLLRVTFAEALTSHTQAGQALLSE
jgi:hypothetical protein